MKADVRIKRSNVTQQVAAYIREKIDSGEWKPGDKIESETQLSEKLGVSRVSIRGAIQQFIAIGKLESIQGKGTFVRQNVNLFPMELFTFEDSRNLLKVMQFRASIERDAAFYAAQSASEEDILYLRENFNVMTAADQAGDTERSWDYDMHFHKKIAAMSGNQFYYDTLELLFQQTYDLHLRMMSKLGTRFADYFHPAIVDAIEQHDPKKAQSRMEQHLTDFFNRIQISDYDLGKA